MSLEQKISDFLERADQKPGVSKLVPYTELIWALRQRRWTYAEIAGALRKEFGVTVSPSTIFAFVKVRAKKSRSVELLDPQVFVHPLAQAPRKQRFHLDA